MKNLKKISLALLIVLFMSNCKKNTATTDTPTTFKCTSCTTTPEAQAANNTSTKGIYIGVLIGSTGTIKFDIANSGTSITGIMIIDGVTVNLTTSTAIVSGQKYSAVFTGLLNGSSVSVTFSINADGTNPVITLPSIPGHPNAAFLLNKETSTSLIEAYNGTYSTTTGTTVTETGTFNMLLSRSAATWSVIIRASTSTSTQINTDYGTISNNMLIEANSNNKVIATLSGDQLDGKFTGGNSEVTTVTGKRVL